MQILEHGQAQERTLLFFPCTAEPVWAFADTITLLSQRWHVFQVVYDGHQPEYPGDFTSVEQTVDEVISYLKSHGVSRLGGAYGCSMGGACLTRLLALGEMPIDRAIIDGGITPYQLLYPVRKLLLWRDIVSFKMAANSRKILEAAFPPERFTTAGHDPKRSTTPWKPTIVRHFKEKSIDASNAKFNWGIKNGKTLAELLPDFRFVEEHSLTEGMAAFAPVYKLLDRLPAVRNISNKIIVLEKEL